MTGPYKACGKQVLRGTEHVADAASTTYAQIIADALNGERDVPETIANRMGATFDSNVLRDPIFIRPLNHPLPVVEAERIADMAWNIPEQCPDDPDIITRAGHAQVDPALIAAIRGDELHRVTQHTDGSRSCICGRRWDMDDEAGDTCPGEQ